MLSKMLLNHIGQIFQYYPTQDRSLDTYDCNKKQEVTSIIFSLHSLGLDISITIDRSDWMGLWDISMQNAQFPLPPKIFSLEFISIYKNIFLCAIIGPLFFWQEMKEEDLGRAITRFNFIHLFCSRLCNNGFIAFKSYLIIMNTISTAFLL